MGLRIGTNTVSLAVLKDIRRNQYETDKALKQMATGSRLNDAGDDPASFVISENLKGQAKGLGAAKRNADNAIAFIQVAEGGLNEQNNLMIRMRELAIQAASDTVGETERGFIDEEYQQLRAEVDRIAHVTEYGKKKLLTDGAHSLFFQVGTEGKSDNQIKFTLEFNTDTDALGLNGTSLFSKDDAADAIGGIDQALSTVGAARASYGAMQSRLEHTANHLMSEELSVQQAGSEMAAADMAQAISKATLGMVKYQFHLAVLAQANSKAGHALKLLEKA